MPKFVIGIGSQRAGSTLLHRILDECTDIFMHPVKELHYYDTLYGVRQPDVLKEYSQRQIDRELDRLISDKAHGYINKRYKCYIRTNKILATQEVKDVDYLDLYRPCIAGNEMLGEITPEYMILPEEGVKRMAEELGSNAKIILISRDPVERFISAFKLLKNYSNPNYNPVFFEEDLLESLETMPSWIGQQKQMNDYEAALNKYLKYFDDVLFLSFEGMIKDVYVLKEKLETFLGVELDDRKFEAIFFGKKVNQIGETAVVSEKLRNKVENMFRIEKEYLEKVHK
ncbi:sulfotransferase [Halomonas sp. R1t8]|uniref:sulfotransferase n=1 Tax=unclassified Halomonas TaxID=2609666 RepID=UPI00209FBF1A|nr:MULTISPECIES: sulfotransferase [unclassified Halomonas]MCP1304856.1 sulfotransferase [Halomonas sp. R1t8]MCP1331803.1 sulfotransferase [Halomonas sp. R1t4]